MKPEVSLGRLILQCGFVIYVVEGAEIRRR